MATALRILDDGAWVSVDDERRVSVSELWRPAPGAGFCDCRLPDLLVGGFVEVGVDGRTVEVRAYGDCIRCGASGTTGWLPVGRLVDGEFRHRVRETALHPAGVPRAPAARRVDGADADDGDEEGGGTETGTGTGTGMSGSSPAADPRAGDG